MESHGFAFLSAQNLAHPVISGSHRAPHGLGLVVKGILTSRRPLLGPAPRSHPGRICQPGLWRFTEGHCHLPSISDCK